ncbi:MAG TPA: 50S ribosomal protein L11 methyltransferase [Puia sp.]|nr:50S ribosomal protein L11 methyltransferase [Puia sp.]
MNYVQLSISPVDHDQSEILIARLADAGFDGFEEEEDVLHAFSEESNFHEEEIAALLSSPAFQFSKKIIAEKNWNEEWENNFQPVIIDDFCVVRASFHPPFPGVRHDIVINPKMSFGTGHHPTTFMMMEALRDIDLLGKSVLDFGTGTGILAILAEKCGAKDILAIDNNEWSIRNASENISSNQCRNITIKESDSTPYAEFFDIILANVNRQVIAQNLPFFQQHLRTRSVLIVSGLLHEDASEILRLTGDNGFSKSTFNQRENWICLRLEKI